MKYKIIQQLLTNSDSDTRKDTFKELITDNPRNKKIKMHQDYYDGNHWRFDNSNTSNTTRSGKNPWGEHHVSTSLDKFGRPVEGSGQMEDVTFAKGQLQVFNYTKLFPLLYQDFAANSDTHLKATLKEDDQPDDFEGLDYDAINEKLKNLWNNTDLTSYAKAQIVRSYVYSVLASNLIIDDGIPIVEAVDADELYPIYKGSRQYGTIRCYLIDKSEAKLYGVDVNEKDTQDSIYTEVHIYMDDTWQYAVMVDGEFVEELQTKTDGLQFDPYSITPGIDHPFRRFDDRTTEDTEIESIIQKNDSLNAYETMSHVSNSTLALPRPVVDMEAAQAMAIDVGSEEFKDSLRNFRHRPGVITTVPFRLEAGENLGDAFYKKVDRVIDTMFEDAGVPRFLVDGANLSQVSEETVILGMSMLIRKIEQKRERILRDVKMQSIKYLIYEGLLDPGQDYTELEFSINFNDLSKLSQKDTLDYLAQYKDIFPSRFVQKKALELMGDASEFDDVIELEQGQNTDTQRELERIRAARGARDTVINNQRTKERDQQRLAELTAQIETNQ